MQQCKIKMEYGQHSLIVFTIYLNSFNKGLGTLMEDVELLLRKAEQKNQLVTTGFLLLFNTSCWDAQGVQWYCLQQMIQWSSHRVQLTPSDFLKRSMSFIATLWMQFVISFVLISQSAFFLSFSGSLPEKINHTLRTIWRSNAMK